MNKKKIIFILIASAAVTGSLILGGLLYYGFTYVATENEQQMPLPGDDLIAVKDRLMRNTCAITIDAPPEKVWQYIVQIGQNKAGFYSFDKLERFFGFDIHNVYKITPEWQSLKTGEWLFYHQNGIGSEVIEADDGRYFTTLSDTRRHPKQKGAFAFTPIPGGDFAWTWNFILKELPDNKTRFLCRCDTYWSPNGFFHDWYIKFSMGIPSIVMITKFLETIKSCAEGNPPM